MKFHPTRLDGAWLGVGIDTVVFALKEVVRRSQVQDLKKLITRLDYEFDPTLIRKKERSQL